MTKQANVTVLTDENGMQREYAEVKRKARVGDRVKITEELMLGERHAGEVYTAIRNDGGSLIDTDGEWNDGSVLNLNHDEYVVLEPTGIVIIDGARYREEKRKAAAGDRILITGLSVDDDMYRNGDMFTVARLDSDGDARVNIDEYEDVCVTDDEYVVLTPINDTSADRIASLERRVAELEARLAPATINVSIPQVTVNGTVDDVAQAVADVMKRGLTKMSAQEFVSRAKELLGLTKSPQQLRDEIVERAKRDVTELVEHFAESTIEEVEFVVNRNKRTIVALLKYCGTVTNRGIAKCAPGDVFNAHIGRAIALRRALGLPVPDEYLNAPQPTEVRVGDVVQVTEPGLITGATMIVTKFEPKFDLYGKGKAFRHTYDSGWLGVEQVKIIDDSRGETEVSA
ncbi:hypothetical protein [Brevibacillus agri]|uniref:hypothetical protein n=1 Tax=Brevibacillus agri TaxID=51101 RepID=UPI0004711D40|nr:hypothetical protein [Brevibacillus agri]